MLHIEALALQHRAVSAHPQWCPRLWMGLWVPRGGFEVHSNLWDSGVQ